MKIAKSIFLQAASEKYEHYFGVVDHLLNQADNIRGKYSISTLTVANKLRIKSIISIGKRNISLAVNKSELNTFN